MRQIAVWDLFVRFFHWSLVVLFFSVFFLFDEEGALHEYAGYAILLLIGVRLVWGFVGGRYVRFSSFPPNPVAAVRHLSAIFGGSKEKPTLSHNPLGALMVYNLLLALVVICVTGIMMTMDQFWGVAWVEEAHELAANYTLFCVMLHVLGVMIESWRSKTNLVLAMINGKKEVSDQEYHANAERTHQLNHAGDKA